MTNRGELILTKYTREFPFLYTVEGTLNGKEFEYFCGVHLDNVEQETLKIDGFEDVHNFEDFKDFDDFKHENEDEYFQLRSGFSFYKTFGMKIGEFIDACKNFIENDFDNEDNFLIFSYFGEIENIEIIKKAEKHNGIYFLIKDKTKSEFFELVIPQWHNANFGGDCFKLLTSSEEEAIEHFGYGDVVDVEDVNLYI